MSDALILCIIFVCAPLAFLCIVGAFSGLRKDDINDEL